MNTKFKIPHILKAVQRLIKKSKSAASSQLSDTNSLPSIYPRSTLPIDIELLVRDGLALHQQGRFTEAKLLYARALEIQATHFDALNFMGILAYEEGGYEQAIDYLSQAIEVQPHQASCYNSLGVVLQKLGHLEQAVTYFESAININPQDAEAHNNLGIALKECGLFERAAIALGQAITIDPSHVYAHNNLGNVLNALERFEQAIASYDRAINLDQKYADAYYNRGVSLKNAAYLDNALSSFDRAIDQGANHPYVFNNRGAVLHQLRRYDEAIISYEQAISLAPKYVQTYNNKAVALYELRRYDEALISCEQAIALDRFYEEAYENQGNVLRALGLFEEALKSYDQVLTFNLRSAQAHCNRGATLQDLQRYDEAIECYNQAIILQPDNVHAHWNLSLCQLLLGNFVEGWRGHEWRWKIPHQKSYLQEYKKPLWLGDSSPSGKTILIWAEQGLGDTIQFCRYISMVASLGAKVIFEVQTPLVSLLQNIDGINQIISRGNPLPDFDYHCPLLSLPLAFHTQLESIPVSPSYIEPIAERLDYWKRRLGEKTKPRIGVVWSSTSLFKDDQFRSMTLAQFIQCLPIDLESYEIICLQKEIKDSDVDLLKEQSHIRYLGGEITNFSDTAALISSCDLVISTCTSVPHLAGAMGVPTWILISHMPDWRWLTNRVDTPWYPSIKLYRQEKLREWDGILKKVRADIKHLFDK